MSCFCCFLLTTDRLYDLKRVELDMRSMELERSEMECRRRVDIANKNFNLNQVNTPVVATKLYVLMPYRLTVKYQLLGFSLKALISLLN